MSRSALDTDMVPAPGAPSPDGTAAAGLIDDVVRRLPIGLAVHDARGARVFANPAGEAIPDGSVPGDVDVDGRTLAVRRFEVHHDGRTYAVSLAHDVTDQRRTENELFERAFFDALTGLPNRDLVQRTVRELAGPAGDRFAVAFIDLDSFKHINDFYGHAVGDQLLVMVATRLSACLEGSDLLARIGGDEFVLVLSPAGSADEIAARVEDIAERLRRPYVIEGYEILTSASIGVAVHPDHGTDFETLKRNADSAMYRSKSTARGRVRVFDDTIEHAVAERARTEARLRLAIRDRRLCCSYQPKVDFRADRVTGVEVLLRWRDEDGVIQAPGDFIDLAVELGLMDEITHMVVAETVESLDLVDRAFGRDVTISVNVAARQANDGPFMRSLIEAIDATGRAPRFMLELTEEAFFTRSTFQTSILPMVREVGARVSIDDFGVGYSSLSALADITADEVKVDRSFITNLHLRPRSQAVLKAIESLAGSLGMSIVVEGVETHEELAYLMAATRISCAQGYYFGKPVLLEEIPHSDASLREIRTAVPDRAPFVGRVWPTRVHRPRAG